MLSALVILAVCRTRVATNWPVFASRLPVAQSLEHPTGALQPRIRFQTRSKSFSLSHVRNKLKIPCTFFLIHFFVFTMNTFQGWLVSSVDNRPRAAPLSDQRVSSKNNHQRARKFQSGQRSLWCITILKKIADRLSAYEWKWLTFVTPHVVKETSHRAWTRNEQ